jgi:hypothetical protein
VPCDGSTQKVCEPRSAGIFLGELNRALTPGTQRRVAQSLCRLNISDAIDDIATSQTTDRHCHVCDAVESVSSAVLSREHFASHAPSPALSHSMRAENELVMRSLRRQTLYLRPDLPRGVGNLVALPIKTLAKGSERGCFLPWKRIALTQ